MTEPAASADPTTTPGTTPPSDPPSPPAGDKAPASDPKPVEGDKAPADKTTEEKPAEAKADAPTDTVDITFPEGFVVNEAVFGEFKALATELKLPTLATQKLADLYVASQQAQAKAWEDTAATWRDATRADKDIGGAKFDDTVKAAQRATQHFGTPELRQLLAETGLGNHPEIVRAFAKIGAEITPDTLVTGGRGATPSHADEVRRMFPNSPSMWPQ